MLGALSALSAGITTLVDRCHIQNSPLHADAAVGALTDVGIRAVFRPRLGHRLRLRHDPTRTRRTCVGCASNCCSTTLPSSPLGAGSDLRALLAASTILRMATVDAVVLAAHPGNVDTVIVAGHPVTRHGRLVVDTTDAPGSGPRQRHPRPGPGLVVHQTARGDARRRRRANSGVPRR